MNTSFSFKRIYYLIIYLLPPPTISKVFFFFSFPNFCVLFDQTLFSAGKGFYCEQGDPGTLCSTAFHGSLGTSSTEVQERWGVHALCPQWSQVDACWKTTRRRRLQELVTHRACSSLFLGFIPTVNGYVFLKEFFWRRPGEWASVECIPVYRSATRTRWRTKGDQL